MSSGIQSMLRLAAVAGLLGLSAVPAAAQATGSIRGRVVEASSLRALSGVQVFLVGEELGSLTNAAGEFLLLEVPAGEHQVQTEMIGYGSATQTVTVGADEVAQVEFTLTPLAIDLDAVVVTGTPGAVSKRTLGNAVTTIDAIDVTEKTTITNVAQLLQAKTPGVTLLPSSGTPGAAPDIRIRGASSLIGNEPVIYIDGVRVNTEGLGSFTPSGAAVTSYSGLATSAFDLINPEDIASIEVIKGPAAATLYGADAANGVIQIITKKGRQGNQPLRWTVRYEQGWNDWALDIPDNFTRCTALRIDAVDAAGLPVWPGCQGAAPGKLLTDNPMDRDPLALRAGMVQSVGLSMRGGGDRYSFYIGAETSGDEGVFLNSFNDKKSLRANFAFQPTDVLDFQINTSYLKADLRLPLGGESAEGLFRSAVIGQPGHAPPAGDPERAGWGATNAEQANAYDNTTATDRLTLGTTINLRPFSWFRNRLTLGMDYTSSLAQVIAPPGSIDAQYGGVPEGVVAQRRPRTYNYTLDYAGTVDLAVTSDVHSATSFGVQSTREVYESINASGRGFGAPGVTLIGTAASNAGSNSFAESKSLGFFVQEQIGWQNRLFLTGAVRMDNSSVFGTEIQRIFYPKASLAWILSEEPSLQGWFDSAGVDDFKLRAAWGQAGRAPDPFAASQTYTVDQVALGDSTGTSLRANSIGNVTLEPERGSEIELGFEAALFENQLGLDFTFYNKRMNEVIISAPTPGSSGFGGAFFGFTDNQLLNLGETLNRGVELAITATPVRAGPFVWDSRLNFSANHNELVSFGDDRESIVVPGASYGSLQQHREGYPLAGYWADVPQRSADGKPILDDDKNVQLSDSAAYIGPSAPTREIGFANTFTLFGDFRVFVLLDYKGGHYLYNHKEYARCSSYGNCERMSDPQNVDPETGKILKPEAYVWTQAPAAWIEEADFVKLRDVSLTYTIPATLVQRFGGSAASVTLAGHNLALFSGYSGIDPETNNYGNRNFVRADAFAAPMMRRVTMSLNVSF